MLIELFNRVSIYQSVAELLLGAKMILKLSGCLRFRKPAQRPKIEIAKNN